MRRLLRSIFIIASCSTVAYPQSSVPDSVIINRIKLNRVRYVDWDRGENLRSKVSRMSSDVFDKIVAQENFVACPNCPPIDPNNDPRIKRTLQKSDVIAIGRVVRTTSALTPNEAFIFTDAQFLVDTVWFQSRANVSLAGEVVGKELTVTEPGGHLKVAGHKVEVLLSNLKPLEVGRSYLLFLKYIPESGSYEMVDSKGFDLTEKVVVPITDRPNGPGHELLGNSAKFTNALLSSVTRGIQERGK